MDSRNFISVCAVLYWVEKLGAYHFLSLRDPLASLLLQFSCRFRFLRQLFISHNFPNVFSTFVFLFLLHQTVVWIYVMLISYKRNIGCFARFYTEMQ